MRHEYLSLYFGEPGGKKAFKDTGRTGKGSRKLCFCASEADSRKRGNYAAVYRAHRTV